MPRPRPLSPLEARQTIASRFGPRADRLRQIATRMGVRPYRVFLVWTKATGEERGEGTTKEVARREILPTPRVQSLDAVTFNPFHAGVAPVGSVRIDRISATMTADELRGLIVPERPEGSVPEPYDFFYEVVEDGRGDPRPTREKFRLLSEPFRRAGKVDWTLMLERVSGDRARDGSSPFEVED